MQYGDFFTFSPFYFVSVVAETAPQNSSQNWQNN
jgi:hypothetical protein